MIDTTTQVLAITIVLLTLFITAVLSRRRRTRLPLRVIPAYQMMPTLAGQAIEADRPVHVSFGSAGIGGANTLLAVASAELAYQMARRAAIGDRSPILTLSDTSTLPLAQDTLRRAYQLRGRQQRFQSTEARWYPSGARSLAFAAAITAMMGDDSVASNVMAGSYGPELALIMEASARRKVPVIAVSDQLDGQAVAYALSDQPLIGEEVFVAGSYLGENPAQTTISATIDVLRWLLVAAILAAMIVTLAEGG